MRPNAPTARVMLSLLPALPTALAVLGTLLLFSLFLLVQGQPALDAIGLIFEGAFGSSFAWQSTLLRASPLMLTALCVALPAQVGLIVIGGEGALALGGMCAAIVPQMLPHGTPWLIATPLMAAAGMLAGGFWIGAVGALRQWRGVNETISSLLMSYIAIALFKHLVEGPLRDPASLNKPSTYPVPDAMMIGSIPGLDTHWGLFWGVVACIAAWVFVKFSTKGFAMRVVGGSHRAARLVGLPVNLLALAACILGGAAAGLGGMFEVAGGAGQRKCVLARGLWLRGHPRRVRRTAESARDHRVRADDRRHRGERFAAATPARSPRRHHARLARPAVREPARVGSAWRAYRRMARQIAGRRADRSSRATGANPCLICTRPS
ncbi:hypothetical protein R69658_04582 [Paraburkholderia aspalathi]|uniref:Nucleoside ABC transporter membrane protein n=1 Tax=Paraburkholderia aspalathi TaxID=1324617 RepID=A0ABM8S6W6_9BURK|nr:hypothetical protein R69658_04582 [Paraburkholderia aspalathi]